MERIRFTSNAAIRMEFYQYMTRMKWEPNLSPKFEM